MIFNNKRYSKRYTAHNLKQVMDPGPSSAQEYALNCSVSQCHEKWCLDSGATSHMCKNRSELDFMRKMSGNLLLANNDTLYVPELRNNLVSKIKITKSGFDVLFRANQDDAFIVDPTTGKKNSKAVAEGDLYYICSMSVDKHSSTAAHNFALTAKQENRKQINVWHERLGHVNEEYLKMATNRKIRGLQPFGATTLDKCEICINGKQHQNSFADRPEKRTSQFLEIIHSDLCGLLNVESPSGKKYFATFVVNF